MDKNRVVLKDTPLTAEERNMEGFDYRGFASFYILQQWNAVFHPDPDKTSRKERAEAYFFFVDEGPYWEEQRDLWCNEYLNISPSVLFSIFDT